MKIPYQIPHGSTIDAAINQIERLEKNGTFLKLKKSKLGPFSEGFKMPKEETPEDFEDIPADDDNVAGGGGAPADDDNVAGGGGAPSGKKGKAGGGAPSGKIGKSGGGGKKGGGVNLSNAQAEELISDGMNETVQKSLTEGINSGKITEKNIDATIQEMNDVIKQLKKSDNTAIGGQVQIKINNKIGISNFVTHSCGIKALEKRIGALLEFKSSYLNTQKSPAKSPSKKSSAKSPSKKSPAKSPSKKSGKTST
jgi:hypothetical protein